MKKRYLLLVLLLPAMYFSQTTEEKKIIAEQSNKVANAKMLQELQQNENAREIRIANYLAQNPTARAILKDDESGKVELMDILANGDPIYKTTTNEGASITARANRLYNGGALGINVQGQSMTVGVWDGGPIRDSHQEFIVNGFTKVSVEDFSSISSHATHVGGTIAAQGINPLVRGIAFNASLISYDWTNDLAEMLGQASTGLLMSNHSYGPGLTSNNSLWVLGAYNNDAKLVDQLCFNNPYYLPVWAAGNNRNDTAVPYSTQISQKFGYDLLASEGVAKNVMTVAASGEVLNYVNNESVSMSSFSSFGPTDDGRIKPDISTKGVNLRSTVSSSDTATGFSSGTSMAAPGVTGVVALLQQYHNQLYNTFMRAATVKGLILHTADEAGGFIGPDYEFGWGLINTEAGAKVIRDKNLTTNRSIVKELNLANNATYTQTISANSSRPLKVSISWTDPAYPTANTGTVDPSTIYLVNDLDVKVTAQDGTVYYPWKLAGMASTFAQATNTGTNQVDNFERIDIANPSGNYTITVTHKGTLLSGNQNYTLIASSQNLSTLATSDVFADTDEIQVYPNPVDDILYVKNTKSNGANIVILDMTGRILLKEELKDSKINVKFLQTGNYMLIYKDKKDREVSLKFIKK